MCIDTAERNFSNSCFKISNDLLFELFWIALNSLSTFSKLFLMSLYWGLFNSPFINFSVELISELINSNTFCFFSFLLKPLNSIASFSFFNFSNSPRNSVIACCNEASLFDSSINFNVFAFNCSYLVLIELNLLSLRELSNWDEN
ncbi:hypothetical protein NW731_03560 [Mycoplasmopsis felis]|uniref:hypothetical protein n=1 Tax=Mycoplasmopsis felis TaxID=33923 RepID=UPI0021DF47A1|nr:hypothetical protein [Mycoplasmopsis felis]MCU9937515.1 hypothetical protein [Mycoplasmopsis felis]